MLYGCCAGTLADTKSRTGFELIPDIRAAGFDFVELPLAPLMEMTEEAFREGPLRMVSESLPCPCLNVFLPGSLRLTGPEARHPEALEYARRALGRAALLGARVVVMGSAGARNLPPFTNKARGTAQLADFLRALAPITKTAGVKIAIEPLNRLESNIINTFSEGLALAREVGSPDIGVLLDSFHQNMSGEAPEAVLEAPELLLHVHVAQTLRRAFPAPGDNEDYARLIKALRDAGYTGTISLEATRQNDGPAEARRALETLKAAENQ